jgi:hypothetical protein
VGNKTAQTIGSEKRCFSQLFMGKQNKVAQKLGLGFLLCETQRFKSITIALRAVSSWSAVMET